MSTSTCAFLFLDTTQEEGEDNLLYSYDSQSSEIYTANRGVLAAIAGMSKSLTGEKIRFVSVQNLHLQTSGLVTYIDLDSVLFLVAFYKTIPTILLQKYAAYCYSLLASLFGPVQEKLSSWDLQQMDTVFEYIMDNVIGRDGKGCSNRDLQFIFPFGVSKLCLNPLLMLKIQQYLYPLGSIKKASENAQWISLGRCFLYKGLLVSATLNNTEIHLAVQVTRYMNALSLYSELPSGMQFFWKVVHLQQQDFDDHIQVILIAVQNKSSTICEILKFKKEVDSITTIEDVENCSTDMDHLGHVESALRAIDSLLSQDIADAYELTTNQSICGLDSKYENIIVHYFLFDRLHTAIIDPFRIIDINGRFESGNAPLQNDFFECVTQIRSHFAMNEVYESPVDYFPTVKLQNESYDIDPNSIIFDRIDRKVDGDIKNQDINIYPNGCVELPIHPNIVLQQVSVKLLSSDNKCHWIVGRKYHGFECYICHHDGASAELLEIVFEKITSNGGFLGSK